MASLEWFGLFTPHRELIHAAFERQQRGEVLMLVAEVNHFPAGQAWIDLTKKHKESVGVIWAVRVIPLLQNLRIGTRLITAAERVLARNGFAYSELRVEKSNAGAKRLYERTGYRIAEEAREDYSYTTPEGIFVSESVDEWILRKPLWPCGKEGAGESASDRVTERDVVEKGSIWEGV